MALGQNIERYSCPIRGKKVSEWKKNCARVFMALTVCLSNSWNHLVMLHLHLIFHYKYKKNMHVNSTLLLEWGNPLPIWQRGLSSSEKEAYSAKGFIIALDLRGTTDTCWGGKSNALCDCCIIEFNNEQIHLVFPVTSHKWWWHCLVRNGKSDQQACHDTFNIFVSKELHN